MGNDGMLKSKQYTGMNKEDIGTWNALILRKSEMADVPYLKAFKVRVNEALNNLN